MKSYRGAWDEKVRFIRAGFLQGASQMPGTRLRRM